jgi:hypothetical protein
MATLLRLPATPPHSSSSSGSGIGSSGDSKSGSKGDCNDSSRGGGGGGGGGGASAPPIGFVHMQARDAVQRRYFAAKGPGGPQAAAAAAAERQAHARLVGLLLAAADPSPDGDGTWRGRGALPAAEWLQCLRLLPMHACRAADVDAVRRCLCCLGFVQGCVDAGPSVAFELMNAYAAARASDGPLASALQEAGGGTLAAAIAEYHEFLKANLPLLVRAPSLLLQQASNAPEGATSLRTDAARRRHAREWVEWTNGPRQRPPTLATLTHMGSLVWAAAWAPDSRRFALGGADQRLHIFDASSFEELETLTGHTDDLVTRI